MTELTPEPVPGLSMGSFAAHGRAREIDGNGAHNRSRMDGWGMLQDWEKQAACQNTDIRIWFGSDSENRGKRPLRSTLQTLQAKAICSRCSVLDECRLWAMESGPPWGILGMMTEAERRKLALQDQTAWQQFWRRQDRAVGRRRRMRGDHNANKTHCKYGHEYTPDNTSVINGRRHCLACQKRRTTRYRQQKHARTGHWD